MNCRKGAAASTSCCRMVWLCEYQRLSAPKMLQVPSVTMNGGSRRQVTSDAVDQAAGERR